MALLAVTAMLALAAGPATRPSVGTPRDNIPPATQPAASAAQPSATRPARTGDPALDFLLDAATNAPATRPAAGDAQAATRPANPFAEDGHAGDSGTVRPGQILLSSGQKVRGKFATTPKTPLRVWVEKDRAYREIAFGEIRSAVAHVEWERNEREWQFVESGSDIKRYSGKTYPIRELQYVLTLKDGTAVRGSVVAPIHLKAPAGHVTFVLHKRQKGEVGQSIRDLAYVQRLDLD